MIKKIKTCKLFHHIDFYYFPIADLKIFSCYNVIQQIKKYGLLEDPSRPHMERMIQIARKKWKLNISLSLHMIDLKLFAHKRAMIMNNVWVFILHDFLVNNWYPVCSGFYRSGIITLRTYSVADPGFPLGGLPPRPLDPSLMLFLCLVFRKKDLYVWPVPQYYPGI